MNNQTKLIAITGGSGAGKTWLADQLQRALGAETAARLSLDDFYRDRSHLPLSVRDKINFDHPRAIDWALFERVLRDCLAGHSVRTPRYNFTTHARLPRWEVFVPRPLVLVEGLWLLQPPAVAELFELKIHLDCPAQLRLQRRLYRDVAERGRTPDSVCEQFLKAIAPMHEQFVVPQAQWADIVVKQPPGERDLPELVEMLRAFVPQTHFAARAAVAV